MLCETIPRRDLNEWSEIVCLPLMKIGGRHELSRHATNRVNPVTDSSVVSIVLPSLVTLERISKVSIVAMTRCVVKTQVVEDGCHEGRRTEREVSLVATSVLTLVVGSTHITNSAACFLSFATIDWPA